MLFVDTADPAAISDHLKSPAVRGFTTNPTLMARAANVESLSLSDYMSRAVDLCRLPGLTPQHHIMIQGVGTPDAILKQAKLYTEQTASGAQLWIKLSPTQDALSCCAELKKLTCKILVTAVFTAAQAAVATEAGADGIAVYLGRMLRQDENWRAPMTRIAGVMREAGKMLLMASFPDLQTVETALDFSRDLTVPPVVLSQLLDSPHTAEALSAFGSKVIP